MKNNFKTIIGRDIGIVFIKDDAEVEVAAKIDTGAYRSAVHADKIEEKDGVLHFRLFGSHPVFDKISFQMQSTKFRRVNVENSFGSTQERYEVPLKVRVAGRTFTAHFSLADRAKKRYPILLGRTMLNKRFVIDTSMSNLDGSLLKKQGITMPLDEEGDNS